MKTLFRYKNSRTLILIALLFFIYSLIYINRSKGEPVEFQISLFIDIRQQLSERIDLLLPSPQAQLLSGILLGEKKDLPGDFKIALRDTSTIHIVVVSGQNLTMLAGFLMYLAGIFHRKTAIIVCILAIILYVLLTGAEIPVLRAALMSFLVFLGTILGRQRDSLWILFISAALLLLINPFWLHELSFQLSFLATFGIIVVSPAILKLLKQFPLFLASDLSVTLGAQLMVIPIIAQSFHQISLVSVIANVLVGWTTPFIMILGTLMLMFSLVFMPIAQFISLILNALLTYFVYIVYFFASLPFAWEYIGSYSLVFWLGYYLLMAGVVSFLYQKDRS